MADLAVAIAEWEHGQGRSRIGLYEGLGSVTFTASANHDDIDSYEVRVRAYGDPTILDSENIGKPTPDGSNEITVDMTALLTAVYDAYGAGNYTVSVAAIDADGATDSVESNAFALPLA